MYMYGTVYRNTVTVSEFRLQSPPAVQRGSYNTSTETMHDHRASSYHAGRQWTHVSKYIKAPAFTVQRFSRAVMCVWFLTNRSSNFGLLGWWSFYSGCIFRKRSSSTWCWSLEITRKKKGSFIFSILSCTFRKMWVLMRSALLKMHLLVKKMAKRWSCYFVSLTKEQKPGYFLRHHLHAIYKASFIVAYFSCHRLHK